MATLADLEAAEAAYHALMLGQQPKVFVDQNGERIEYTASNANRLNAYIQYLKRLLYPNTATVGPMGFWL